MIKANGVKINFSDDIKTWEGNYCPDFEKAGTLRINPNADISTLEHEYQHFLDDKALGYPGFSYLMYAEDSKIRTNMETKAYHKEIEISKADKNLSDEEKVNKVKYLEALLQLEINKINNP